IELLVTSGRLVDDGGTLRAVPEDSEGESPTTQDVATQGGVFVGRTTREATYPLTYTTPLINTTGGRPPSVTVNITVNVAAKDIAVVEELLQRLGALPTP